MTSNENDRDCEISSAPPMFGVIPPNPVDIVDSNSNLNVPPRGDMDEDDIFDGVGEEEEEERNNEEEEQQNPFEKKKRKKRSAVWDDMNVVEIGDGKKVAECRYCKVHFSINKDCTTTHMKRHLGNCLKKKLALIWRVKEVINNAYDHEDQFVRSMASKMKIKFDKYWGECNLLLCIANVLDPRCTLKMVKFSFDTLYGKDDSPTYLALVRSSLQALYNDYKQLESSSRRRGGRSSTVDSTSTSAHQPGSSSKTSSGNDFMLSTWGRFDEYLESTGNDESEIVKSDLDMYLEEGVHRCKDAGSANFDALEW